MDKITINGVDFTEKEIEAIQKEYDNLLYEVSHIEEIYGYNESLYNLENKKVVRRFKKLRELVIQFNKEIQSRKEIFKEQLDIKIDEALKQWEE